MYTRDAMKMCGGNMSKVVLMMYFRSLDYKLLGMFLGAVIGERKDLVK